MGISPLSPTPLPSSSGGIPTSMTSTTGRPISAMSQPVTASGYMLPQGAMPLPGLTTNGMVPNAYTNSNYNNPSSTNNNAPVPPGGPHNGHLNGPVSHSSPRMAPGGESYYWNQYWKIAPAGEKLPQEDSSAKWMQPNFSCIVCWHTEYKRKKFKRICKYLELPHAQCWNLEILSASMNFT